MKKQTQEKGRCSLKDPVVTYSSELLYHALVRSTDDFIYVCDMKTGVFHYSPQQVAEFEAARGNSGKSFAFLERADSPR